ncbi:ricin B lectin domain-containing protein [Mycotypha africana]|uniref:ricin B lectin domain-containing protein n=1 Tax=Mycotypha africana TaxID=64632 RepID=UPI002300D2D9|nr:ricin B lectin domain-containing protein [Mycotypha africana]KAI8971822.1 ricin B lectin domain-containing protein [Mycotypha africana]
MTGNVFFIKSELNGRVLDVEGGATDDAARIIVYKQKSSDNQNQLWRYENGYFINVKSAKVLDIKGGEMKPESSIIQYSQKMAQEAANQRWRIDERGYISPEARPDLVLDIKGAKDDDGVPVILYGKREGNAASNQRWRLEYSSGY